MLAPYPPDYRAAFAFPSSSYPQRHCRPYGFPTPHEGSGTGLTCSLQSTGFGLGHLCSPTGLIAHARREHSPWSPRIAFWPKPDSILGLFLDHGVYREFAYADHAVHPSPSPPDAGRYILTSRVECRPNGRRIHCMSTYAAFLRIQRCS